MKRYWHKIKWGIGIMSLMSSVLAQTITSTTIGKTDPESGTTSSKVTYPHKSRTMVVGQFESFALENQNADISIEQPICIIGSDNVSLSWLNQHIAQLKEMDAICLIAEIHSEQNFKELQKHYPDVKMAVANVDWVAKFLGVNHYPVLITKDQVMQ